MYKQFCYYLYIKQIMNDFYNSKCIKMLILLLKSSYVLICITFVKYSL